LFSWLIGWLFGYLVGGWLVGWLVGLLVVWLVLHHRRMHLDKFSHHKYEDISFIQTVEILNHPLKNTPVN